MLYSTDSSAKATAPGYSDGTLELQFAHPPLISRRKQPMLLAGRPSPTLWFCRCCCHHTLGLLCACTRPLSIHDVHLAAVRCASFRPRAWRRRFCLFSARLPRGIACIPESSVVFSSATERTSSTSPRKPTTSCCPFVRAGCDGHCMACGRSMAIALCRAVYACLIFRRSAMR